jgi:hypothetical protein
MKLSLSREKIVKANRLADIIRQRKALEKEEKELKKFWKQEIAEVDKAHGSMAVGEVVISLTEKSRSGLDRASLEEKFGADVIAAFVKVTNYIQVDVKDERATDVVNVPVFKEA